MLQRSQLEQIVRDTVYEVVGVRIDDRDQHLLSDKSRIFPVDFLYIFDRLEKQLHCPVYTILQQHDYSVLTIANLASALEALLQEA